MNIRKLIPGLEAIHFTSNPNFFNSLTALMGRLRSATNRKKSPVVKEIVELINKETHIRCTLDIANSLDLNAWVTPPLVDSNHPLISRYFNSASGLNEQGLKVLKNVDTVGYVNLKEGKIYGIYREIPVDITLHRGLFDRTSAGLTDAMIAAILLHEIGHVFGYFEYLGTAVIRNFAMIGIVEQVFGSDMEVPRRVELLTAAKERLRLKEFNAELAATLTDKTKLQLVFVDAEARRLRSELGSDFYDLTAFEFIADQYTSRQGASVALVLALDRINRYSGSEAYYGTAKFLAIEVGKTLSFVIASVYTSGIWTALVFLYGFICNPLSSVYDNPKDRFKRIRQQLIAEISSMDVSEGLDRKKAILADITLIDAVMADMNTRRTLYQYLFTTFIKSHNRDLKQQQLQKDLEQIGHSDLFVAAAKLNTLSL